MNFKKSLGLRVSAFLFVILSVVDGARGDFIASFEGSLRPGSAAPGWSYMWNSSGAIGNQSNYTSLIATNLSLALYTSNGGSVPGPAPGGYVFVGITDTFNNLTTSTGAFTNVPGGHPGLGVNQAQSGGIERYSIAKYTVANTGRYSIENSLLANSDSSVDGLNLRVYVNDTLLRFQTTAPGQDSSISFDGGLGDLVAGDNIYVAVGSNLTDGNDEFALRYSIHAVPEPSSIVLVAISTIIGVVSRKRKDR